MFHNHTNQLPLYVLNRPPAYDPPPRYSRHSRSERSRFDPSIVYLGSVLLFCILILLGSIVIGQVFILNELERLISISVS